MLLFPSSSMRASANTPAETTGACVARFPVAGSLPRYNGGSASASCFSRPARRLLAFSPAWSLNRLTRPFDARVLQSISLPPRTALAATNRSDSCCAGFAPARRKRLSTAHVVSHNDSLNRHGFESDCLVSDCVGKRVNLVRRAVSSSRSPGREADQAGARKEELIAVRGVVCRGLRARADRAGTGPAARRRGVQVVQHDPLAAPRPAAAAGRPAAAEPRPAAGIPPATAPSSRLSRYWLPLAARTVPPLSNGRPLLKTTIAACHGPLYQCEKS